MTLNDRDRALLRHAVHRARTDERRLWITRALWIVIAFALTAGVSWILKTL